MGTEAAYSSSIFRWLSAGQTGKGDTNRFGTGQIAMWRLGGRGLTRPIFFPACWRWMPDALPGGKASCGSFRLFQKFDERFHQRSQFPALASLLTATERRTCGFGFMRYVPAKNSCQFDLPSPSAASDTSQNISSNIVQ
jgi:hypothetical protein